MNLGKAARRATVVTVLAGAAIGASTAAATTASATPTDHLCSADEVSTALVHGEPGAGQRHAAVQFTADEGQGCSLRGTLDMSLEGAPNVLVGNPSDTGPLVTIADGETATMQLRWSAVEGSEGQQTPSDITVTFPGSGTTGPSSVTLPWNEGPIDAASGSGLHAGTIQAA